MPASLNSMEMTTSLFSLALTLLFFTPTSPTTLFNLTTDQHALLAFKAAITLDPHGVLLKNWSTNTPTCSWVGVSCGLKHRRVTALNVSSHELHGKLSPYLGNLTFLRSLDISSNNFTGQIPPSFGRLSHLQHIYLSYNVFSGSLPTDIFNVSSLVGIHVKNTSELSGKLPQDICSNTPKLTTLDLRGNRFYGEIPTNIYKCRAMEALRLEENHFSGSIPSEIGTLSMLRILGLSSNEFTGSIPSSIFNISGLISMYLDNNHLSGNIPTDTPYNLLEIDEMDLSSNNLTGSIPKQFGNLTSLTILDCAYNILTGSIPKQFGNLTSLTILDCAHNILTGELPGELGNVANLETFAAPYNNLSGPIPSSIFNISTLTELSLQQNWLSGDIPSNMGLSVLSLESLVLHYNRLSGKIPAAITNASNLIKLELNRNSLTGPIPNFGNLRYLKVLRLWENKLTGGAESPTHELGFLADLTNCRDLEVLEISDNPLNGVLPNSIGNFSDTLVRFLAPLCKINGAIPSEIGKLKNLQFLHLYDNKLTGIIPTSIGKLNKLQELHLGGNQLHGYIPRELCELTKLGTLNLSLNVFTGPVHECFGVLADSLREVSLASNKLNSTLPSKFWDLSDLVILDLSSNELSGQIPPRIGTWKINQLNLSSNQFTGNITSSIGDCQSLETLDLSSNRFGGSIPESLGKRRGLKTLNLSNNDLSGSIPDAFEDLRFLEQFDVSYNKLEGGIPNGIANSTAQSFVHNSALCGAAKFQVPPCGHGRSRSKAVALIFLKYIVPPFIAVAVFVLLMLKRRRKQVPAPPASNISLEKIALRRITYMELERGTSSFSELNLLGRGSFGSVFKATLSDGLHIAVKVFKLELEGAAESFDTESEILSSLRHRNLLSVISCCTNQDFRALILEYMPNGSLEKWLHSDSYVLDLFQRLDIATDVALALEYLHHGHTFPVVHCDIKPSNVLLDQDMIAHVGDFGISKLFHQGEVMTQTTTLATIGYAAPEYGSEGKISTNGDVYSYGILLLEMFTGKKPTNDMFNEGMSLKDWASKALQENEISEMVAPGLLSRQDQHFSTKEECLSSIFDMAMKCLAISPEERINMRQAVALLHKIKDKVAAMASAKK